MNYRNFAKRACYLATLASALRQNPLCCDIHFASFNGDPNRPILLIKPKGMAAVRILDKSKTLNPDKSALWLAGFSRLVGRNILLFSVTPSTARPCA